MTPWAAAHQASLSFTISQSLLKLMSIESEMLSDHLILCCSLLLLPSIFPSISKVLVTQLSPILSNPMNCSLPGSSVHGIFQARIQESIAIFSSRDLPDPGIEPRSPALQADFSSLNLQGSPALPHF